MSNKEFDQLFIYSTEKKNELMKLRKENAELKKTLYAVSEELQKFKDLRFIKSQSDDIAR